MIQRWNISIGFGNLGISRLTLPSKVWLVSWGLMAQGSARHLKIDLDEVCSYLRSEGSEEYLSTIHCHDPAQGHAALPWA